MKIRLISWCLGFWVGLVPGTVRSSGFTYQGRLLDGQQPAQGSYDLQFSLVDAASEGKLVGSTITQSAVMVSNGLFTVILDFGEGYSTAPRSGLRLGCVTTTVRVLTHCYYRGSLSRRRLNE